MRHNTRRRNIQKKKKLKQKTTRGDTTLHHRVHHATTMLLYGVLRNGGSMYSMCWLLLLSAASLPIRSYTVPPGLWQCSVNVSRTDVASWPRQKENPSPQPPRFRLYSINKKRASNMSHLEIESPFSGVKKRSNGRPGFLANYQPQLLAGNASLLLGLANRLPPPFRRPPSP